MDDGQWKRERSSIVVTTIIIIITIVVVMAMAMAMARQWLGCRRTGRRTQLQSASPAMPRPNHGLLLCGSSLVSRLASRVSRLRCAAACVRARVQPSARYRPARLDACARSGGKGRGQAGRGGTEARRD
jgi:hypothetical protein